jgi:hypothetical protein
MTNSQKIPNAKPSKKLQGANLQLEHTKGVLFGTSRLGILRFHQNSDDAQLNANSNKQ